MATRRLLMIAYYFPPLGGIATLRALRFARHLPEFGWEVTVVAPRYGAFHVDDSLSFPEERVIRTALLSPRPSSAALTSGEIVPPNSTGSGGPLKKWLRRWLLRPDAQVGWYPFALSAARAAMRKGRYNAILSASAPITAHLVASRLHRERRVPWVADFRDFWTDWGRDSPARLHCDVRTETRLLHTASAVTTVSPTLAAALAARGARRVEVLTNSFDPEDFSPAAIEASGGPAHLNVAYLGSYYPEIQDLETAVAALGRLAAQERLPPLSLEFIGPYPRSLTSCICAAGLSSVVTATGFIPHANCVRRLRQAGLLLLPGGLEASQPLSRCMMPGKTFEYLAARRPILVVAAPGTDLATILAPYRWVRLVAPGDVQGAEAAILDLLHSPGADQSVSLERFTSRDVTRRLAVLLGELA